VVSRGNTERIGWTVTSVEETDRVDTVYCPRVPEYENFVLDNLINVQNCPFCGSGQVIARSDGTCECEFCSTAFTVQVQPKLPAFPRTIDGQPIDVPGMPNGGQDANVPPGGVPGDPAVSGDDAAPVDPNADPDAAPDDNSGDSDDSDSSSGGKPPWLKSSLLLRTEAGYRLNEDQYIRRLALRHSHNQRAVLERIRHENGVGNG
jgi:hypothetical protein